MGYVLGCCAFGNLELRALAIDPGRLAAPVPGPLSLLPSAILEKSLVPFRLADEMTLLRKRLFLASAAGFSLSVLLAALEALRHRDIWMILQFPGFLAGASIWGVHSGGNSFEAVMVVVDGVTYSFLFLVACGLVRLAQK